MANERHLPEAAGLLDDIDPGTPFADDILGPGHSREASGSEFGMGSGSHAAGRHSNTQSMSTTSDYQASASSRAGLLMDQRRSGASSPYFPGGGAAKRESAPPTSFTAPKPPDDDTGTLLNVENPLVTHMRLSASNPDLTARE